MHELFEQLKSEAKWEDIIFESDKRIQLSPHVGRFHYYRGYGMYQLHRFDEAEPSLMRAHTLDETQTEAAVMRAQCLEKLSRYKDAMDLVKELLTHMPNDHRLLGLHEFLSTKWTAVEHDAWEKSRLSGTKIVWSSSHDD